MYIMRNKHYSLNERIKKVITMKNSRETGLSLIITNMYDLCRFLSKESLVWEHHDIVDYEIVPLKGIAGEPIVRIDFTYNDFDD